ncbi:MAG: group II intron reverse transcriptase/maturase [Veillonellales bacterium]
MNAQKANNTISKIRQLQRKLYLAAKVNRNRRFHAMYDKIYRIDILQEAWKRVKANGGAGGIDKISIEDVKAYGENKLLAEISEVLEGNNYRPLPVRRIYIPKNDGSKRPLGIPVIKDRIVQMAAKIVIEPVFEADFLDCSFGFRPKRSAQQALDKIYEVADRGDALWVIDADIKDYFGSVNHEKLMLLVKQRISDRRVLKLIWQWLKAGIMEQGEYQKSDKGAPQGSVISPLLSNIYLHYFDYVWTKQYSHLGTLVRYADDFVILSKRKQQAGQAMHAVYQIMSKLELTIHEGKTKLVDMYFGKEGFDFLGFHNRFKRGRTKTWKWYWRLFQIPSHKSMKKMRANIKAEFESPARLRWSLQDMIKLLNPKIVGMRNYYNREFAQEKLWHIDRYVVRKFTKWSNYKRQRQHRLGNMNEMRELIYRSGLARMRVN